MFIGAPLALALATSGMVYSIGKYYDGSEHGAYWAALAGAAGGMVMRFLVGSHANLDRSSAIALMIAGSAAGSVLCYQKSKQGFPPLVQVEDGRARMGVPVPRIWVSPSTDGTVHTGCTIDLVNGPV